MGLFNSFLDDIASGKLEKKLDTLASGVEKLSEKVDGSAKKVVDSSAQAIKKADQISEQAKHTINKIKK